MFQWFMQILQCCAYISQSSDSVSTSSTDIEWLKYVQTLYVYMFKINMYRKE